MAKKKQNNQFPYLLMVGGGLVLLVIAALIGSQGLGSSNEASLPSQTAVTDYAEIDRISIDDAKAAYDAGTAVFLDVRTAETYNLSRIAGSVNIPLSQIETRLSELDKAQWIITYCT